jgi:hypothetical protein
VLILDVLEWKVLLSVTVLVEPVVVVLERLVSELVLVILSAPVIVEPVRPQPFSLGHDREPQPPLILPKLLIACS